MHLNYSILTCCRTFISAVIQVCNFVLWEVFLSGTRCSWCFRDSCFSSYDLKVAPPFTSVSRVSNVQAHFSSLSEHFMSTLQLSSRPTSGTFTNFCSSCCSQRFHTSQFLTASSCSNNISSDLCENSNKKHKVVLQEIGVGLKSCIILSADNVSFFCSYRNVWCKLRWSNGKMI